ncbi:circularly permuted type 2 ATP-grasp protein [uncultured Fibrobacter sp.]|uniref:circularly permuted type 2 ATP-grasp protein n=1 Tax=uncultured Fibrobacter sp. TaxID=261512 RepID=UPI002805CE87|nr:circularly permuted type 2 ATP-grasp protein [uncultured Fibrobacter sp.]
MHKLHTKAFGEVFVTGERIMKENESLKLCDYLYSPPDGFDELLALSHERNEFAETLGKYTRKEFEDRFRRLLDVLNSNDISFVGNAETGELGLKNTDPLPLIISEKEWGFLESALAQRARLYNALAVDIYGEQSLWKKGVLPSILLFANPGFLQVAWNANPVCDIYVHLLSSDIIRNAEGKFFVDSDSLQVPDGLGRALENRIGVSRAFPEMFRSLHTRRLALFFKKFLDSLMDVQKAACVDGKIVMLASPPDSARRSEDAILARYLGISLVENDDLAVRQMQVYLKTLLGLKKIGTIFRRVEDATCDPLELRIDSGEGAVGLISSLRSHHVTMSNFLGTGVLETPLFKSFLDKICQELLGEDLLLPDLPTVWLGNEKEAAQVLDEPENWIFQKIFDSNVLQKDPPKEFKKLTMTAKLALLQAVEKNRESYVAKRYIKSSSAPVFKNGKFIPAEISMRFFAMNAPSETVVMPGGYGVFKTLEKDEEKRQIGEKDIWVLSKEPVANFSLLAPSDMALTPTRAGGDLPSHAAENLYLLGGSLARVNMMARKAKSVATRLSEESWTEMPELPWILKTLYFENGDPENALRNFLFRKENKNGLQYELKEIQRISLQIRDRISEDLWVLLHHFGTSEIPNTSGAASFLPYLKKVLSDAASVSGFMSESMTRGHEWRFQEIGRRLEESKNMLWILKAMLEFEASEHSTTLSICQALLELGDGVMTYHRRYGGRLQLIPILDLLLCDETNPRSVVYQVSRLCAESKRLPLQWNVDSVCLPLDRELLRLRTNLRLADIEKLSTAENSYRNDLKIFIEESLASLENIAGFISRLYLNHAPRPGVVHSLATEV